jgi:threonine synthase
MDVGDPSNFVRMLEIFDHQFGTLKNMVSSYSISDDETRATILDVKQRSGYLTDPHGAVAVAAAQKYLADHPGDRTIFLETAHPIKFYDVVEPLINETIPQPESIRDIMDKKKVSTKIATYYTELKDFLLNR